MPDKRDLVGHLLEIQTRHAEVQNATDLEVVQTHAGWLSWHLGAATALADRQRNLLHESRLNLLVAKGAYGALEALAAGTTATQYISGLPLCLENLDKCLLKLEETLGSDFQLPDPPNQAISRVDLLMNDDEDSSTN